MKNMFRGWVAVVVAVGWIAVSGSAVAQSDDPNTIGRISVQGNERIEPATIASYLTVRIGSPFNDAAIDQSLKTLFATGLFSDVRIERRDRTLLIVVQENPIINRIVFEGNKKLDREDLLEEVQLRPRIVYTRAKVRADVERMLELYRRKGRFAARIEPKVIQRDQNRVDLVFEIAEGPKSKIAMINFIGNEEFSNRELKGAVATKQSRWWKFLTSNDTYDPDRLAYDREQVRQFYLQRGYADFRVVSAVAELTPDRDRFVITFTMEEGPVYQFGDVTVESQIRDIDSDAFSRFLLMKEGQIYNAKKIEDTIELLTNAAGLLGYAFIDIRPRVNRDREARTINITFSILPAPRTYVERVEIHGNVRTLDKVIRRQFRLVEGDAFNSSRLNRSEQRINGLGFFKEVVIEQLPGTRDDRVIIDVQVQEQPTGELTLGAGFSSFDKFMLNFGISERNLLGKGQTLRLGVTLSSIRKNIDIGFTEPWFLGRDISAGFDIFRRDLDYSRFSSGYKQTSTGGAIRFGFALTEYWGLGPRYTLRMDNIELGTGLDSTSFFETGKDTTSMLGYSLFYDSLDNRRYPSRGQRFIFTQDVAGLLGDVRFVKHAIDYDFYYPVYKGFIFRAGLAGSHIIGLGQDVKINNRAFLGGPKMRGFETAGLGPRNMTPNYSYATESVLFTDIDGIPILDAEGNEQFTQQLTRDADGSLVPNLDENGDPIVNSFPRRPPALGGNIYYVASAELKFPLGAAAKEMGIEASAFVDVGSLWSIDLRTSDLRGAPTDFSIIERGGPKPRVSVGIGFSWESPFGPFRIDLAKALVKEDYDRTEFLQFNIGTTF